MSFEYFSNFIRNNYSSENYGVVTNLVRIFSHGNLSDTGRVVILPVDQGFEHGPDRSFLANPDAYDPSYHFNFAIESGVSAYAAPLGMLELINPELVGRVPLILKMNNANSLFPSANEPDQAITSSVEDALRLGCVAIGLTIYPGSGKFLSMIEEAREIIKEAKKYGLAVVIWSYPRGGDLSKKDETAIDVVSYGAHMAALLGANIIKVKIPEPVAKDSGFVSEKLLNEDDPYSEDAISRRISHVLQSAFDGRRFVVFSGGSKKDKDRLMAEIKGIHKAGGSGSIIGRNSFQRPWNDSINMLSEIYSVYKDNNIGLS